MQRIILDTDVGTNADDAVALSLILKSPEIQLEGITTVYGDVHKRGAIAQNILQLCDAKPINIYSGIELPLLRKRKVTGPIVGGMEAAEDFKPAQKHAVDFIIETIMENPKEITLVAIGPMTNIATAIIREPKMVENVKEMIIMGGVTRLGANGRYLETREYNVRSDPEAASVVFSSKAPIVMISLDVTRQLTFTRKENQEFARSGTPIGMLLSKQIKDYMDYMKRDFSYMCDPLAVAVLLDRSFIGTERVDIEVEYDHREMTGYTIAELNSQGSVEVALEVDYDRFFTLLRKGMYQGLMQNLQSAVAAGKAPALVQIGWSYREYFSNNFSYVEPQSIIEKHFPDDKNYLEEKFLNNILELAVMAEK